MNKNKKEISHVKFSPDGRLLAVGDHLGFIYVFEWKGEKGVMTKKKHTKPIKHGSAILHFDFSKDSNSLHSTCRSYELLFW
jgi:WD40 repeat protein